MIGTRLRYFFKTQAGSLLAAWLILFMGLGCYPGSGNPNSGATPKPVSSQPECDDCPSAKVLPDPEPGPGEMINPIFLSWRIYPEGTTTVRLTHEASGTEVREVTRLLEKKDRTITLSVEMVRAVKANVVEASKQAVTLPFLISKTSSPTGRNLDAAPGTVKVLGKSYQSFLSESSGTDSIGAFVTRRWDSDTIPGLLVRLEKETTPSVGGVVQKTVTELVELNLPNWDVK